jgi:homoserine acetyltransferase
MDMFYPFIDNFKDYRLVVINLPMNRQKETRSFSIKDLANYTKEILDDINCQEYSLVGFSLGGVVSVELAKIDQNKIKSLTLLSSYPQLLENGQIKIINLLYPLINSNPVKYLYSRINTNKVFRKVASSPYTPEKTLNKMKSNYKTIFGTLIKCCTYKGIETYKSLEIPKEINLFTEDTVLKYSDISKRAQKDEIQIQTHPGGGHYIDDEYFEKTIFDETAVNIR